MISLLFTIFMAVLVLTIKEMAANPEKDFPEAATDSVVAFGSDLKVVLSSTIEKIKNKKKDSGEKKEEKAVTEEKTEEVVSENGNSVEADKD